MNNDIRSINANFTSATSNKTLTNYAEIFSTNDSFGINPCAHQLIMWLL